MVFALFASHDPSLQHLRQYYKSGFSWERSSQGSLLRSKLFKYNSLIDISKLLQSMNKIKIIAGGTVLTVAHTHSQFGTNSQQWRCEAD